MIGNARNVAIAVALAIVLGALAIVDVVRDPHRPVDRALVPGFADQQLAWDHGETLVHDRTGWHAHSGALLDAAAVDAVVTTLRGARWQRRAAREVAGAIGPQLHVGDTSLAIGQPLAGTEQVWIVRDDAALLVDGWVARALAVQPWQLHVRHPFADAGASDVTLVEGLRTIDLVGHPPKYLHRWIDPVLSAALDDALRAIEILGPGGTAAPARAPQSITLIHGAARTTLAELGPCAGHPEWIAVTGVVDGCVGESAWRSIAATARVIDSPDGVDLRPLPIAAIGIRFADGELALGKAPHVTLGGTTSAVEPAEVTALLAALATRGERADVPTGSATTLVVHTADGDLTLAAYQPDVVVRSEDQVAIRIAPAAYATIVRGASAYRVRTLWAEDPTTIVGLVVDRAVYERGAVLGEWSATTTPAAVEAYVAAIAHARALEASPPTSFAIAHHVEIRVASPDGRREIHALDVGAPIPAGCPARLGGAPVLVARELCSPP